MSMKNRREALIEFLRLKIGKDNKKNQIQNIQETEQIEFLEKEYLNLFVNKFEKKGEEAYKSLSMKDLTEPYNQADMYRHHCDMLVAFATKPSSEKPSNPESDANQIQDKEQDSKTEAKLLRKREKKQKQKLALELMKT